MEDMMALLRKEKRAMTMLDWMKEAKEFTAEILDEKPLRILQNSKNPQAVYRSVAMAGKTAYESQLKMIEEQNLNGMDEMIAMETAADYKTEAMQAALFEKMESLVPNFRERYL